MTMYSPYLLNESKSDLAFTLGQAKWIPARDKTTTVEIAIRVDKAFRYTTGPIAIDSLKNHIGFLDVPNRRGTAVEMIARVTTISAGAVQQANSSSRVRLLPSPYKGMVRITIAGLSSQVTSLVRIAQARLARSAQRSRSKTPRSQISSNLRPSPEIVNKQFLQVTEVGNLGTLQPAQSGRSVVPILSYKREWTGTRTPGFGSKKIRQLPDNPHTVKITEVSQDRYSRYQFNTFTGDHSLNLRPYSDVYFVPGELNYGFLEDRANFQAIQRLIGKANAGIQSNLAQTFSQSNLLLKMITSNATAITQSVRQLKRGNIPGAIGALNSAQKGRRFSSKGTSSTKGVASNWLALQYGWKPLLQDIESLFKLLPSLTSPTGFVHQVRCSATSHHELTVDYPPGDGNIGLDNHGSTTHVTRLTVKYVARFRTEDPVLAFATQLGFTDPISLGWELLPFSFVADWFLPIGDYLGQRNAFQGLTFLGGSKTTFRRTKMESRISYGGSVVGVPQTLVNFHAALSREIIDLSRQPITNWPSAVYPSLFKGNPFAKSNLPLGIVDGTNERAMNAVALLLRAFK